MNPCSLCSSRVRFVCCYVERERLSVSVCVGLARVVVVPPSRQSSGSVCCHVERRGVCV